MKLQDLKKYNVILFTKETLRQIEPREDSLNYNLSYWIKKGEVILLKSGLYITRERREKEAGNKEFPEYIANKIYEPSYLSGEYVMSKFGLLTEGVTNITSVSTRKTKIFKNVLGTFYYYSVTPPLFTGFTAKNYDQYPVFNAGKIKALFDFLYLRFLKNTPVYGKTIEELRINWENLKRPEFKAMYKYVKLSGSRKVNDVYNLIQSKYYI